MSPVARQKYHTDRPKLSEAIIAQVRAAARRYVLAGGSIFPAANSCEETDEYVANIEGILDPKAAPHDAFADALEQWLPTKTNYQAHEEVFTAAWNLASSRTEAAFLFGAFVGLELAALTLGLPVTPAVRTRKAGAR